MVSRKPTTKDVVESIDTTLEADFRTPGTGDNMSVSNHNVLLGPTARMGWPTLNHYLLPIQISTLVTGRPVPCASVSATHACEMKSTIESRMKAELDPIDP